MHLFPPPPPPRKIKNNRSWFAILLATTFVFSPMLVQAHPKVEQARQKAEEARRNAKRAALRRLDKELTFEKLLERRVRVWKGLEPEFLTGNQTLVDWQMQQYDNIEQEYAAPTNKYAANKEIDSSTQFQQAEAAYDQGNYSQALRLFQSLAQQGNPMAQYNVGTLYYEGLGVAQNYEIAMEWFRKSANQGYADAQYNLGVMYENGRGVEQNNTIAASWYRKAANQGHAMACNNLGSLYHQGLGVPKDLTQAAQWYNRALNVPDDNPEILQAKRMAYENLQAIQALGIQ